MPYYQSGNSFGSIAAPIILDPVSVSGSIFLGNISLTLTASTFGAGVSGSSSGSIDWPPASASICYVDATTGAAMPVLGEAGAIRVTGNLVVQDPEASLPNAIVSMVTATTDSVLLSAANLNRKQLSIYNSATTDLYLKFAATAALGSFTIRIPPSGYFELTTTNGVYTGPIAGIWRTTTQGSASITEVIG